jgi:hypothetical protein
VKSIAPEDFTIDQFRGRPGHSSLSPSPALRARPKCRYVRADLRLLPSFWRDVLYCGYELGSAVLALEFVACLRDACSSERPALR